MFSSKLRANGHVHAWYERPGQVCTCPFRPECVPLPACSSCSCLINNWQKWPEPCLYVIYGGMYGNFPPARSTVYAPHICRVGHNHIYIYGKIRCICTVLAKPTTNWPKSRSISSRYMHGPNLPRSSYHSWKFPRPLHLM